MNSILLPALLLLLPSFTTSTAITAAPNLNPALLRRYPAATTGQEDISCGPWVNLENSCAAANPSFSLLTVFASQAPCLCYSSSTWAPNIYDSALATCLSYLSTASPSYYSSIDGPALPRTPCLEVSSLVGPGATAGSISGVPSASIDPNYAACLSWQSISSTCDASISGFATLSLSAEENCLCYTSGTFAPTIFDGYWASCLTYYSTASPSIYSSSLGGDAGVRSPCALHVPAATTTGTGSGSTSTSGASSSAASSGAGVTTTTSAPTSTSIVLTTTAATASATGNGAVSTVGEVSLVGLLLLGLLATIFML